MILDTGKNFPRSPVLIYLDGKLMSHVVYVDTERGIVEHHGDHPELEANGLRFKTYREYGKVRVEPMPRT